MLESTIGTNSRRAAGRTWWARVFSAPPRAPRAWVEITYVGETALVLSGAVTGARYRFGWRGASLPVDIRDATDLLLREDLRVLGAALQITGRSVMP